MFGGNGRSRSTIILTSSVISPVTIPLTLKLLLGDHRLDRRAEHDAEHGLYDRHPRCAHRYCHQ